ncbi:hypothetical protein Tco_1413345, partial [Tanacetum coccineum]
MSWPMGSFDCKYLQFINSDHLKMILEKVNIKLGHTMETIDIAYEWQPPRCDTCKIFDHKDEQCPKKVKVAAPTKVSDDGFVKVT